MVPAKVLECLKAFPANEYGLSPYIDRETKTCGVCIRVGAPNEFIEVSWPLSPEVTETTQPKDLWHVLRPGLDDRYTETVREQAATGIIIPLKGWPRPTRVREAPTPKPLTDWAPEMHGVIPGVRPHTVTTQGLKRQALLDGYRYLMSKIHEAKGEGQTALLQASRALLIEFANTCGDPS